MKCLLSPLLLAASMMFCICSQGQNIAPFWSLSGNSNATTTSKLGTTNLIPVRLLTNNIERLRIDPIGKVGIGIINPRGKLTVLNNGGVPATSWTGSGTPLFVGFAETTAGNADYILGFASSTGSTRPVIIGRKSRGTLAAPSAVLNNDYILSMFASAYDGSNFQSPASIDFIADGTTSSGNVPTRISFSTGSSATTRTERLKITNGGNFNFNNSQMFLQRSTGILAINTLTPNTAYKVDVENFSGGGLIVNAGFAPGITATGSPAMEAICDEGEGLYARGQTSGVNAHGDFYGIEAYVNPGGSYAGYFSGDVYTTGTYLPSDEKLKQNIVPATSALDIVSKLQPKMYEYRHDGNITLMNLPKGTHYGFMAQDVQKVLPSLIKESKFHINTAQPNKKRPEPSGGSIMTTAVYQRSTAASEVLDYQAVNYTELIPILVRAVQEQQDQIEQLKNTIAQLLTKGGNSSLGSLGQNTPNPVSGITNVSVTLPTGFRSSRLEISDNAGRILQVIPLAASGTVKINTAGWSSGIYHYSLIIDEKTTGSKQLIIAR